MRPYSVVDDEAEEEPRPRVIPISSVTRAQPGTDDDARRTRQPWMPREDFPVPAPRNSEPAPLPPPREPVLDRTHRLMLLVFVMVCATMIVGMVSWRLFSEPGPASTPIEPPQAAPVPDGPAVAAPEGRDAVAPPAPGSGAITTEIRVLQPEYTVAAGDTLASIARRHGTSIEALASINKLENRNSLSVGQRLILP